MVVISFNEKEVEVVECISTFSRLRGLMFSKKKNLLFLNKEDGWYPIHMFFVFFPIDVIWLDSKFNIVDIKRNVKSFTPLVFPKKKNRYVLEMSSVELVNLSLGDKIKMERYLNL